MKFVSIFLCFRSKKEKTKKMFGLYTLLEAAVFFLNAVCILHNERFLKKYGFAPTNENMNGFGNEASVKQKIINFISSVKTVMRYPLIFINIFMIVVLGLFG